MSKKPQPARIARPTNSLAEALKITLISTNEDDRNWEAANVVDGLFFIGRALHRLADIVERKDKDKP